MNEGAPSGLAERYWDLAEQVRQFEMTWAGEVLPPSGTIVHLSAKRKMRIDGFDSVRLVGDQFVMFKASGRLLRPDGLPSQRLESFTRYLRSSLAEKGARELAVSRERRYRELVASMKALQRECFMQMLPPIGADFVSQEGVSLYVLSHDRCVVSGNHLLIIGGACKVTAAGRPRIHDRCEIEVELALLRRSSPEPNVFAATNSTQAVSRSHLSNRDALTRSPSLNSAMSLPTGNRGEPSLDATRSYPDVFREGGRFGSHPGHDAFDDESGA